jgi:8-oxo-dGTP pyrophosphatase MutT (NUDIX family)
MERYAAVLIPIFADEPHDIVFIERAAHLRRHAGEIGFPGGAVDAADAGDHRHAALREVHEEIGIPPERITVVAELDPVRQHTAGFVVSTYVGVVDPAYDGFIVDANEVAATHRVPLAAVVAPGAVRRGVEAVGERHIQTFLFDHGALHVWGLTGQILNGFVQRYQAEPSALRSALDERLVR